MNTSPVPASAPILYTKREVAAILRVTLRTVCTYIRDGRIPCVYLGKTCRIPAAALDRITQLEPW